MFRQSWRISSISHTCCDNVDNADFFFLPHKKTRFISYKKHSQDPEKPNLWKHIIFLNYDHYRYFCLHSKTPTCFLTKDFAASLILYMLVQSWLLSLLVAMLVTIETFNTQNQACCAEILNQLKVQAQAKWPSCTSYCRSTSIASYKDYCSKTTIRSL